MNLEILKNVWYMACLSEELKAKKFVIREILSEPLLFFREENGTVKCLKNICPHRGIPLSYGRMVGSEVECPYHGWKFNGEGTCTAIPSLTSEQDFDCRKIKVKAYPVQEQFGQVWVFVGDPKVDYEKVPPIPALAEFSIDQRPQIQKRAEFLCHIDHAVIGLMDPAHGPYVHKSWFWRSERSSYEKKKNFAPVPFGFQMVRHPPSANSKAYRILGGQPTTEITFSLPSVRVERIKVGEKNVISYSALTPMNPMQTQIYQMLYWDMPWMSLIKPFISKFTEVFLGQDVDAVTKQQEGLKYDPTLMLIRDADTQAKWYYALKKEFLDHQMESRQFQNPVKESVLSWRS